MRSQPPTFQELLDWVEGRLDEEKAADVAERATAHPEAVRDSLEWIREFLDDASVMPLEGPPAEVGTAARAAFRRLRMPWTPGELDGVLDLAYDSRTAPLVGVRAGQSSDTAGVHLELLGPGIAVRLDVDTGQSSMLTVSGVVTIDPATIDEAESPVAVVLFAGTEELRTAPVDAQGHFVTTVGSSVDRLDVVTTTRRLRASITDSRRD